MKTLKLKGYDAIELLLIVLAVGVIGVGAYLVIKNKNYSNADPYGYGGSVCEGSCGGQDSGSSPDSNYPTANLQNTFQYGGYAFPNMPTSYTEVGKDNSQQGSPVVEYLTTQSVSQVTSDAQNVCKTHNFQNFGQGGSADSSESSGGVTFNSYEVNCDAKNNDWTFDFVNGQYFKEFLDGGDMKVPALTTQQQANLQNLTFLEVTGGAPTPDIQSGIQN